MSDATRGQRIKQRRADLGITSKADLSRRTGVSVDAVTAAEDGTASENTYLRLEAWLTRNDRTKPVRSIPLEGVLLDLYADGTVGWREEWKP